MPPRYVYWTIIVDGQPTAFRSGSLEDIMPTFNRLKEKQPSAELKWFQNGQLWASRHDAQDFMRARGERGRSKDPRQGGDQGSGIRERGSDTPERAWNAKPDWKTRSTFSPRSSSPKPQASSRASGDKPEWKPKGSSPEGRPFAGRRDEKPRPSWGEGEDRPAGQARSDRKPEWKPKGTFKPKEAGHASGWGEKPSFARATEGKPGLKSKPRQAPDPEAKPEWQPKSAGSSGVSRSSGDKPAWKPKGTFKPKEEGHRPSTYAKATVHKSARDQARSSFKPKAYTPKTDDGMTRSSRIQSKNDKLEWKPASSRASTFAKARADRPARQASEPRPSGPNAGFSRGGPSGPPASDGPKRKWVPKAEYKKSLGIEAKRDDKWRPGGEHKDPKQKYKDAKKAKWTKFKANIRARSTKPRTPKDE